MNKQTIAVIMGGPSREHEVSIKSGEAMLAGLDVEKYEPIKIVISKSGSWTWYDEPLSSTEAMHKLAEQGAIALIGLHGSYGEDGTIQALLERFNIPYTGSGVAASLLAMDKSTSNDIYRDAKLLTPQSLVFNQADQEIVATILETLNVPVVIKPTRQGSSVGVHIVKEVAELEAAIHDAFSYDQTIIAQQFVQGKELSCGVIEKDGSLVALPPTEIIPIVSEFFDYKAKYTDGGSEEITPAQIPEDSTHAIQQLALRAHQVLGCSGYSRTDVIMTDDEIYVIETNTLPGMTEFSILPAQAKAAGLNFGQMIDLIIAGVRKV